MGAAGFRSDLERNLVRGTDPDGFRPEIQALRAFAVLAVVAYHLWPSRLPGGYVGVDIFFVVSGFLITGHLLRELTVTGTVRVIHFWTRRIRRLLPASLVVLLATSVAVWMFVPQGLWQQFFREIGASALYIENWALASNAVDYLAADNLASPVQHFWSLGVEEQLYAAWPLLLIAGAALARRRRGFPRKHVLVLLLAGVGLLSLAYSTWAVTAGSPTAYFETHARVWEFAAGGLLAWFGASSRLQRVRSAVSWIAWAGLAIVVLTYNDATPFPGAAALPPVLLTVALIWAGSPSTRWSHTAIARWKPVQTVGDLSYSLYLWHWPLIVLLPFVLGRDLRTVDKLLVLLAGFGLAALTRKLVEDPVRFHPRVVALSRQKVFAATAAAMAVLVGVSGATWGYMQLGIERSTALAAQYAADPPPCFGAASAENADCVNPELNELVVPAVQAAASDSPVIYRDDCQARYDDPAVRECRYGVPGGTRVALVGDSHAASWFPAVESLAQQHGWEVHTFLMGSCPFTFAVIESNEPGHAQACAGWNQRVQEILEGSAPFELVLTSHYAAEERFGGRREAAIDGFRQAWEPLTERGTDVVVIRDVPILGKQGLQCLTINATEPQHCDFRQGDAMFEDYAIAAAEGSVSSIDMTKYICPDDTCPTRIGGALVYRDTHHLTGTYSRTLAPHLGSALSSIDVID
jgi:peptidoglycan/LPS O-acetylase OafA/YrhL